MGADARLVGLALLANGDSGTRVALDRLELDHIAGEAGGLAYRIDGLVLDKLEARPERRQITAGAVHLTGLQVSSTDGNLNVSFPHIGFPSGLQVTLGQELFAPHVSLEDGHVSIRDLAALPKGRARPGSVAGDTAPGATPGATTDQDARDDRNNRLSPFYRFFDALSGNLNIDLVVDLTLPWIGRRRATHYFRIPIKDGTIDFARLEDDVHWLEGTFLTLDVVGDTIVLARDLPLVPYSSKALLQWRLDPADVPLARYQRVHLRNLFRWELPPRDKARDKGKDRDKSKDKGKSRLALHALALEKIQLELNATEPAYLELPNGSIIQFGDDEQPGLVNLNVGGALRYSASHPAGPTALEGSVGLLDATIKELVLGAAAVSMDRLHIGSVDHVEVGFAGFKPTRLSASVGRFAATNLRVHF